MSRYLKVQSVEIGRSTDAGIPVAVTMTDGSQWVGSVSGTYLYPEVGQTYVARWDGLAGAHTRRRGTYVWLRRPGQLPMHEDVPAAYGA